MEEEHYHEWFAPKLSELGTSCGTHVDSLAHSSPPACTCTCRLTACSLVPHVPVGYLGLYKKRTGSHGDGCAVFYRTAHLQLVEWKGVEFQRGVKVLDRDNVAIVAKFKVSDWPGDEK